MPKSDDSAAKEDRLWLWNEPADIVFDLIGASMAAWVVRWLIFGGELETPWFPVLIVGCFGVGVIYRVKDLRRRYRQRDRTREQRLLQLARDNRGAVSPALVAAEVPELSMAEARTVLDRCAKHGLCSVDSDAAGNLVYHFPLGEVEDVEARQWRELGEQAGPGVDVEA